MKPQDRSDLQGLIRAGATISEAMAAIDSSRAKIAILVDEGGRLLGTVTDGDIRRALLTGTDMNAPVDKVMNSSPVVGLQGESPNVLHERMVETRRNQLPIVDEQRRVVAVVTRAQVSERRRSDNLIFVLAGGLGTRLRPMTDTVPKPMLPIGDKPILEHLVEGLVRDGFHRVCFAVRYKAEQIRAHFGDGSRWGAEIDYVCETQPLGTAGALGLLREPEELPLIVINGDILTELAFGRFVEFHNEHSASATIGARPYSFEIPYGVLDLDDVHVRSIAEKPAIEVMVNAGIYCINWEIVDLLKDQDTPRCDMPDVLTRARAAGMTVTAYPIYEYWVDIGHADDFQRAHLKFSG